MQKIGQYHILGIYSEGGMSRLFLAEDEKDHRKCIVKMLLPQYAEDKELIEHLMLEGEILHLCKIPRVVSYRGSGISEGLPYLVMEYVAGTCLFSLLNKEIPSFERALRLFSQICQVVMQIHALGVVHGDISSKNIIVHGNDEITLIDFGKARLLKKPLITREKNIAFVGSYFYMAPELYQDWRHISFASDVYALGVLAYELFLGRIVKGQIDVELLPELFQELVKKATAHSIHDRYQTVEELYDAFSSLMAIHAKELKHPDFELFYERCGLLEQRYKQLLENLLPKKDSGLQIAYKTVPMGHSLYFRTITNQDAQYVAIGLFEKQGVLGMKAAIRLHRLCEGEKGPSFDMNKISEIFHEAKVQGILSAYAVIFVQKDDAKLSFSGNGLGYLFLFDGNRTELVGIPNQSVQCTIPPSSKIIFVGLHLNGEGQIRYIKEYFDDSLKKPLESPLSETLCFLSQKIKTLADSYPVSVIYIDTEKSC